MTDLVIMPDLQAFLSQFVRSRSEATDLIEQRAYAEIPGNAIYPLVRITDLGGTEASGDAHWLERARVQTTVLGGSITTTGLIARTLRGLYKSLPGEHHLADGTRIVITRAVIFRARRGSDADWPSGDGSSAKPTSTFDSLFTFHP